MERLLKKLAGEEPVRIIAELAAESGVGVYLAGGGLRDTLLGRPVKDLDFALDGAEVRLPRLFAQRWGGTFFWLDEARQQGRVVKKVAGETLVCDFAPLRGASIEDDLRLRDFTINALALPVTGEEVRLIDPLGGIADLRGKTIRACSAATFENDPLRLLRAHRFAAELGFTIEEGTWDALLHMTNLLASVAAERIRDELFKILAAPGIGASFCRLREAGLITALFPARFPLPESCDAAVAVERACSVPDRLAPGGGWKLAAYLDAEVESGITMLSLMKLAASIGVTGQGTLQAVADKLRLGRKAARLVELLCRDEKGLFAGMGEGAGERQLFRFFRDREPAGPARVILAWATGAVSPERAALMLAYYLFDYFPAGTDLLLTGSEVMELLGIEAGTQVGEVMAALREAEADGLVNDREEARSFVRNLLTSEPEIR
jgi:poly(A) polymerase